MKTLIFTVLSLFTIIASAYVVPVYRDLKPATQAMLERQDFGLPAAASTKYIKIGTAGAVSAAAVTLTSFTHQPDVPRNIVITPGTSTGDVASCTIVVNGTNIFGRTMSENFVFANNASSATTGTKAFKTLTSVVFPANCEDGGFTTTWDIGVGELIGLKACMANAGDWAWSEVGGAYEATRATIAVSASAVESNTADFNGTMDGATRFLGFFVQNFACHQ